MSAAAALDGAVNLLAIPWLIKLQREEKVSNAFQGVCLVAIAAEMGTAFVLAAGPVAPIPIIAALVAASVYKFALIVLAP